MFARITPGTLAVAIFLSIIPMPASPVAGGCGSSSPETGAPAVVKKVDHIMISCAEPEALFNTLTRTLGLPVAWPLTSYPGFTTGGAYAGNVNIEVLRFGGPGQTSGGAHAVATIYGIVFESYPFAEILGELRQRGADPAQPHDQMREMNGTQVKVWSNVTLDGLCTSSYIVYLCEYTPWMQEALAKRARENPPPLGGIGLMAIKEIGVASTQLQQTRKLWKTVFAPAAMSKDGDLRFDSGPAVSISDGSVDVIGGIVLDVDSLEKAKVFLERNGLLGEASADQISIDPSKVQGLNIRLVQKQ